MKKLYILLALGAVLTVVSDTSAMLSMARRMMSGYTIPHFRRALFTYTPLRRYSTSVVDPFEKDAGRQFKKGDVASDRYLEFLDQSQKWARENQETEQMKLSWSDKILINLLVALALGKSFEMYNRKQERLALEKVRFQREEGMKQKVQRLEQEVYLMRQRKER